MIGELGGNYSTLSIEQVAKLVWFIENNFIT